MVAYTHLKETEKALRLSQQTHSRPARQARIALRPDRVCLRTLHRVQMVQLKCVGVLMYHYPQLHTIYKDMRFRVGI